MTMEVVIIEQGKFVQRNFLTNSYYSEPIKLSRGSEIPSQMRSSGRKLYQYERQEYRNY